MLAEIVGFIENNLLGMGLVFLLLLILVDPKALERVSKKSIKWCCYIAIIGYYLFIVIDIIQLIIKNKAG